jgi:hypothetical protein
MVRSEDVEKIRPITITVASIAFIIFGLVTIVFAVLVGITFSSTNISDVGALVAGGLLFLIAVMGILDTVAGYGLWNMKRWAAIMGMLLGILGLIVQSFYYLLILAAIGNGGFPLSVSYYAGSGSPWADILLVLLIAISWKSFEPSATQITT